MKQQESETFIVVCINHNKKSIHVGLAIEGINSKDYNIQFILERYQCNLKLISIETTMISHANSIIFDYANTPSGLPQLIQNFIRLV
jgi:hypothetical protein